MRRQGLDENQKEKTTPASVKEKKVPTALWTVAGIASLAFFIGAIFYDFWAGPVATVAAVIVFVINLLDVLFGVCPFIRVKNQQVKSCIRNVTTGVAIGALLVVIMRQTGYGLMFNKIDGEEVGNQELPDQLPVETVEDQPGSIIDYSETMDVGTSQDTDVVGPDTAIVQMETLEEQQELFLSPKPDEFLLALSPSLEAMDIEYTGENKAIWVSLLDDEIKRYVNSKSEPPDEIINGTKEFTVNTERANSIEDEWQGYENEGIQEVIELREKAFKIYETKALSHLLASDYHKLAKANRFQQDWEGTLNSYLRSIKYEMCFIKFLPAVNDDYYKHLYKVAVVFQCIGDIPVIQKQYKDEAYFLSSCFFEIVCKNTFDEPNEETGFLASYYAGMVNHKLFLFHWASREKRAGAYIEDSIVYYEKSLDYEDYRKQRGYQHSYMVQMCKHAQNYIKRWGKFPGMRTVEEYQSKEKLYSD